MIKANELRRLNKVVFAEDGTVFDVLLIEETGLIVKNEEEEFWCEIDQFEGIPITEEWLLRLSDLKNFGKYYFHPFAIFPEGGVFKAWIDTCEGYEPTNYTVSYVHQLQNLYFALTGEELEIKSDTMS